jgi:hypothetical protein
MFCFCGPGAADADPARDCGQARSSRSLRHDGQALCAFRRGAEVAHLTGRSDRGPRAPSAPLSHAPHLQRLGSPHHKLVKPRLASVRSALLRFAERGALLRPRTKAWRARG